MKIGLACRLGSVVIAACLFAAPASAAYVKRVPASTTELASNLKLLKDNISRLQGYATNLTIAQAQFDWDYTTNQAGSPDFYFPIKRARLGDATTFINNMITQFRQGGPYLSMFAVQTLYDMIDRAAP